MAGADAASDDLPALSVREASVLWAGLAAITLLAWIYLFRMPMPADGGAMNMAGMAAMAMPMTAHWTPLDVWLTLLMWAVMMVAMMTPSAAPMITLYARISSGRGAAAAGPWIFTLGYLAAWTLFSAIATALQAGLQYTALISGAMRVTPVLGGVLLIAAGVYQMTPLKKACLRSCQSPLGFFMSRWRDGAAGAFGMGLRHGVFCVGCCWMLMALLFVAGVMNLLWVAAISVFVLAEKATHWGRAVTTASGIALIVAGIAVAIA